MVKKLPLARKLPLAKNVIRRSSPRKEKVAYDLPVIPRKKTGKKVIIRSSPRKKKVTNDPPVTPRKEAGKKLTYESEVELMAVDTPSKTDKLSSKEIEKSKRMRNKNIDFLSTFIKKNYETIQNTDDHDFFKKMKYNQSLFDGLNKDFFRQANPRNTIRMLSLYTACQKLQRHHKTSSLKV